jgi:hypothetical protein
LVGWGTIWSEPLWPAGAEPVGMRRSTGRMPLDARLPAAVSGWSGAGWEAL